MLNDGIPRNLNDILAKYDQRLTRLERKPRGATGDEIPTATTYAQPEPPSGLLHTGDLWIDTDNENQMYRWDGDEWILVRDAGISRIEIDAASTLLITKMDFEAAADNVVTTYWQATAPGAPSGIGDLWVDTDDKKLYRWNGTTWVDQVNTSVGNALSAAGMVAALGDSRIKTYFSFGTPIPEGVGDLWADTDDNNRLYRWTGTTWIAVRADTSVQSAATAAILLNNYSANPIFDNWLAGDTTPVGFIQSGAQSPIKETTRTRTAPFAVRYNLDDVTEAGIVTAPGAASAWVAAPNMEYFTITVDLQLVAGNLSGSGVVIQWAGLTPTQQETISFADEFVSPPTLGVWYRITKVIKRATSPGGSFTGMIAYLMGNASTIDALAIKEIVFDQFSVRKSTTEEQAAYGAPAGTVVTLLPDIGNEKITTFYTADADVPTPTAIGDLWYVIDRSNLVRRWDGSIWASLQIGTGALDPGSVDGPILAGDIQLTSTIRTAATGPRLELDAGGFRQYSTSEALKTHFPSADDAPNRFAGDAELEGVTVTESATFEGTVELSPGAAGTLASGITAPGQAPGLALQYDSVKPPTNVSKTGALGTFTLNPNEVMSINWRISAGFFVIYQKRANGTRGWNVNPDGTLNGDGFVDYSNWEVYGETEFAGQIHFVLKNIGSAISYIGRMNSLIPVNGFYNTYARLNSTYFPQISNNGTHLIVVESHPTTKQIYIRRVTMSATSYGAATIVTFITTGEALGNWCGLEYGNFDFGAPRYVVALGSTDFNIWPINTSGVLQPFEYFTSPTSNKRGMAWDGTNFWVYGSEGNLYKMSTYTWTTESSIWWVGHTWDDTDAGGTGLHETDLGAKRSITMKKRAKLKVTFPNTPGAGGADEPNGWKVYLQRATTVPANSAMHLQTSGITSVVEIVTPNFAGAAPPVLNNFPNAEPSYWESGSLSVVDSLPKFWVDGSGDGRWELEEWHVVGDGTTGLGTTFQNSWANNGTAGWPTMRFTKDRFGFVWLWGRLSNAGSTGTPFTLPTGYRPPSTWPMIVRNINGSTSTGVNLNTNGTFGIFTSQTELFFASSFPTF